MDKVPRHIGQRAAAELRRYARQLMVALVCGFTLVQSAVVLAQGISNQEREFIDSLRSWKEAGISRYSMTVVRRCECALAGIPVRISVVDGIIDSIIAKADLRFLGGPEPRTFEAGDSIPIEWVNAMTIDAIFDEIGAAISTGANAIDVSYSEEYGFPTAVEIDYRRDMHDEELILDISEFNAGA
jgi:hypothetical protein